MPDYLKLPLRFEQFFERKQMDTCSIQNSIMRNLHLLITTTVGENKQDAQYGSTFWESDYDVHLSNDARREMVIDSMTKQIAAYEKRIINVVVEVTVKQVSVNEGVGSRLRRRIEIIISAQLARSNEPFRFATGFFIGPMSFD